MKYSSGVIIYTVTQLLLLDYCMTKLRRKPTNSVTIRQSASKLCTNNLVGEFVEHDTECSMFYLCVEDGDAILATCPPTMLFNSKSKLCDLAENVVCKQTEDSNEINVENPINGGIDNMITDAATYCARIPARQSKNRIIYIGSSSSCSQYYVCYYGKAILQECSPKLHWNAATGKCDAPERAHCTLNEKTTRPATRPTRPSSSGISITGVNELVQCPPYGQHLFPHMQRCEFFIYCVKGQAILQQCPFYYYFDVVSKSCQWSRKAMCVKALNLSGTLIP